MAGVHFTPFRFSAGHRAAAVSLPALFLGCVWAAVGGGSLVAHPTVSKEVRRPSVAEGRLIKNPTTSTIPNLAKKKGERLCPFRKVRQANRAVRHRDIPDRREHGVQGRTSAVGAPPTSRRLITGGYRDPISNVPADPAARDRVFCGRERFVCEITRPLFRPLAEKRCFHLRGDVVVSRGSG
jgi:hypothetical protein